MDSLIKRYKGKTTSEGHKLDVRQKADSISIGFKHSGEYEEEYNPYINVALIKRAGAGYRVGWFRDDGEEPADSSEFTREEDLLAALDQAVELRSKQVGPMEG